jgi:EmrB/QacA subfamily drug resistance transporter
MDDAARPVITHEQASPPLGREVGVVATIVVCGALTTVLDTTIVSVAIDTLGSRFGGPVSQVQWVMTAYLLALSAVIPLTGWATDRYGGKRVWLLSLSLFAAGSMLCGVAWSLQSLIVFRVLQGLGGGMVAPVGMTLVAQAAGPQRMGRAMSMVGIPMMLGPVLGPVLGGVLISAASWRWIFWLNLPITALTVAWSARALTGTGRPGHQRLDLTGLLLLSPGLASLTFGVSAVPQPGGLARFDASAGISCGLAMLAAFVVHALRRHEALLDLRHFAHRTFAAAASIQFLTGAALIGAMLLLPLYYQVGRGDSAWATGLQLMPQGIGAALAMSLTGRYVDRGLGKTVVCTGVPLLAGGFLAYTWGGPGIPPVVLALSLLVLGLGIGCLMAPVSAAAYSVLGQAAIPRATATLNITQRVGGTLGTAVFAVVLQHHLAQLGAHPATAETTNLTAAFAETFWCPLAVAALALVPALMLPGRPGPTAANQTPANQTPANQTPADTPSAAAQPTS